MSAMEPTSATQVVRMGWMEIVAFLGTCWIPGGFMIGLGVLASGRDPGYAAGLALGIGNLIPIVSGIGGVALGYWGITIFRRVPDRVLRWVVGAGVLAGFAAGAVVLGLMSLDTLGVL